MLEVKPFSISQETIDRAIKLVPEEDLISASHDYDARTPTTDLLLILSTPRSGSTLLCDLIDRTGICCPTEYFQPDEYLPILAQRWDCVRNGALATEAFSMQLRRYRTSEAGWLGIKLHPTHLPLFEQARPQFGDLRWHGVHLIRRDQIAQAISYHIADKTQKWSSAFVSRGEAEYDYSAILNRLCEIIEGNAILLAAAATYELKFETIYYEDLVEDSVAQLQRIPGIKLDAGKVPKAGLGRQSSPRNQDWAKRFAAEYKNERLTHMSQRGGLISQMISCIRKLSP